MILSCWFLWCFFFALPPFSISDTVLARQFLFYSRRLFESRFLRVYRIGAQLKCLTITSSSDAGWFIEVGSQLFFLMLDRRFLFFARCSLCFHVYTQTGTSHYSSRSRRFWPLRSLLWFVVVSSRQWKRERKCWKGSESPVCGERVDHAHNFSIYISFISFSTWLVIVWWIVYTTKHDWLVGEVA